MLIRCLKLTMMVMFTSMLLCNPALADRFINLNDGTMLDTTTNLRWLRDANCFTWNGGGNLWANDVNNANSLTTGNCGLTDGSLAGDWHLPTLDELYSLVAQPDNYRATSLNNAGFYNVDSTYWTSTTDANDASKAWAVATFNGYKGTCGKENCYYRTWPVRNEKFWLQGALVIGGKTVFGNQLLNSTSVGALTLMNTGSTSLGITAMTISGSNPDQFSLALDAADACSSLSPTLAAGAKCTVNVKATPTSSGSKAATLTIATASGNKELPLTVTGYAFNVTYLGNGHTSGSAPSDNTNYATGATVTVLGNSSSLGKTGYNFNGWNSSADGSGTSYNVGSTFNITSSVNLYAKWTTAMIVPSGLVGWWRAEGDVVDLMANTGIANLQSGSSLVEKNVAENATATAACDSGETIKSYTSVYGAGTNTVSCGSCTIGANSCSVTYSNAICTDPAVGTAKSGTLSLTCTSSNSFPAGKVGQAIKFNGSSDYVTQGKTYKGVASSNANSSFTMEFWAKPTSTISNLPASQTTSGYAGASGQRYAIFPEMQDSTTEAGAGVSVGTNGIVVTEHAGNYLPAPLVYTLVDGDIPSDGWLHVAVVYENLVPKLYLNGVLKQTGLGSGRTVYPSSYFGGNSYGFYSGLLDEVHIFNRALTLTEIQNIYTSGSAGFSTARINPVLTFGAAPAVAVGGSTKVSVSSSSGLPVTLTSLTPATCTISGTTVSGVSQGTCTIAANQASLGIYNQAAQSTQSFTITAATAPTLTTTAATGITTTSAILNATVNANYSSDTVSFEYGTTTAYGNTATISQSPVNGGTPISVSAAISNLDFNKVYHYRIKAVNAVTGTSYGNDMAFTTSIRRFVDLSDGTMLDTANSLRWLKKSDCLGSTTFSESNTKSAALASGACGLTDGSAAGNWRVPTKSELESLVAAPDSYRTDSLIAAGFSGVPSGSYCWTSTDYGNGSAGFYYIVSMYNGGTIIDYDKGYRLWPVRSGAFVYSALAAAPATVDFGSQYLNSPTSRDITISNSGTYGNLVVSSITTDGSDSSQFTTGSGTCGAVPITVAPGSSCTLPVIFTPLSSGAKSTTLKIESNSRATATQNIALSGTGAWVLNITKTGSGAGSITADSGTISWNGNSGVASYLNNSTVTIYPTPSSGSIFGGWSGDCSGSGSCSISMTDNRNVSALFNKQSNVQIGSNEYGTLTEAYVAALGGDILKAKGMSFTENLNLNRGIAIIFKGGYADGYGSITGYSALDGVLTIGTGRLTVDRLVVK